MRTAESTGNLPWALRMLADRSLRRATFRLSMIQHALLVVAVVAIGLIVLWFAVAMLWPLATLIINLSG